jgi:hypothetical protein
MIEHRVPIIAQLALIGKLQLIDYQSTTKSALLLLWANDELSYDRFNVNAANIYKLAPKFDDQNVWNSTPAPIAVYAKNIFW